MSGFLNTFLLYWPIVLLTIIGLDYYGRRYALGKDGTCFSEELFKNRSMYWVTIGCLCYDCPILVYVSELLAFLILLGAIPVAIQDICRNVAQLKALEHRPQLHSVSSKVLLCVIVVLIGLNVMPQLQYDGNGNLLNACFGWPHFMLVVSHNPATYNYYPSPYKQLVSARSFVLLFIDAMHWGLIFVVTVGGAEWLLPRLKSKSH